MSHIIFSFVKWGCRAFLSWNLIIMRLLNLFGSIFLRFKRLVSYIRTRYLIYKFLVRFLYFLKLRGLSTFFLQRLLIGCYFFRGLWGDPVLCGFWCRFLWLEWVLIRLQHTSRVGDIRSYLRLRSHVIALSRHSTPLHATLALLFLFHTF